MPDPLRAASALSPVLFALGDPDLLVELLSSSPAGVVLVEAAGDLPIVYCNDAFQRWAPLSPGPAVGRPLPELFAWTDRPAIRAAYREVIRTGRPVHLRSAAYHEGHGSDARVAYWNVSHYPLQVPAGPVSHVLSFTVDVTDRAGARARMDDAQHRVLAAVGGMARHLNGHGGTTAFFRELSATVADLVSAGRAVFLAYDAGSQTISARPGGFGFAPGELEGLRAIPCRHGGPGMIEQVVFGDLVVRDDITPDDPRYAEYGRAISALGVRDAITVPWRAGKRRLGAAGACDSTRRTGFTDEDVWVLQAAVTAAALVWEHRQADDALALLRERESAALHQQIEQSLQLEQLKANFLKLASHELRAPLAVVRGYMSMMEDGTLGDVGEQVAPVVPMLRAKLDEMNRLINEMLETARLEDSALQLEMTRIDLREIVHEAVRSLEPLAGEHHRLVTSTPGVPVPVEGDRSRLAMVVTNLVHNALKYSPGGGEVRVACSIQDGRARLAVCDQGVGITAEDAARLFTRFGRIVRPETAQITGVGLGLYLARDLARRHGGDVEVESEPGAGSTFTLTLPLTRPAPAQ
jgi:signal transduction histidine kinase